MTRQPIPFDALLARTHHLWDKQWLLLSSGDFQTGHFNTMTVGWGSLGTVWNRPFAQAFVRHSRYTYQFMEKYDTFTLCAFPQEHHKALQLLGSRSGRDGDKIAESGLTPIPATKIAAPAFAEADLIIECQKMYWDDVKADQFLDASIEKNYPQKDYHRIYFGEIVYILGGARYSS
jgi:flavin reductase (DIM6/NTAB) family NADH-FMN oxidoreductase RutF